MNTLRHYCAPTCFASVYCLRPVEFFLHFRKDEIVVCRARISHTHLTHSYIKGARCSFVLRAFAHGAMGRRIDPSWGGPIELFLVPNSAPRLVYQRLWYVLSCLWDCVYKRTLAVNRKE